PEGIAALSGTRVEGAAGLQVRGLVDDDGVGAAAPEAVAVACRIVGAAPIGVPVRVPVPCAIARGPGGLAVPVLVDRVLGVGGGQVGVDHGTGGETVCGATDQLRRRIGDVAGRVDPRNGGPPAGPH